MADAEGIRAAIDAYTERFTAGDRDGWLALWADDARMEDPIGTPLKEGRDAIAGFYDENTALADSVRLVRTGPVRVCGAEAAFPMQVRPVIGGAEFVIDVIDVMVFGDDNRIIDMRAYWNPAEMRPADD